MQKLQYIFTYLLLFCLLLHTFSGVTAESDDFYRTASGNIYSPKTSINQYGYSLPGLLLLSTYQEFTLTGSFLDVFYFPKSIYFLNNNTGSYYSSEYAHITKWSDYLALFHPLKDSPRGDSFLGRGVSLGNKKMESYTFSDSLFHPPVYSYPGLPSGGGGGGSSSSPSTPPPSPINGACGSANGTTVPTTPTTNLCNTGTPSSVTGMGPWSWSCIGSNGGSTASCSANITTPSVPPSLILSATPSSVSYSGTSLLSWSSTGATSCTNSWSASTATGGNYTTPPLIADTTYILSCAGSGGTATGSVTVTVLHSSHTPHIFWSSYPVMPDEVVLLRGEGFLSSGTYLSVSQIPDGAIGSPLDSSPYPVFTHTLTGIQIDNNSASFLVPSGFTNGVYVYKITNAQYGYSPASSTLKFLNTPDIWFYMGNDGMTASPGGTISLYGRSITLSGSSESPSIALIDQSGSVSIITATTGSTNEYSATFTLPSNIGTGSYTLYSHNGHGGAYGWSKFEWHGDTDITAIQIKDSDIWPTTKFIVDNMSGATDQDRIAEAILLAHNNGGGVIEFNTGTYQFTNPIILPNRTLLKGKGRNVTFLTWSGVVLDSRSWPSSICGSDNGDRRFLISSEYISWPAEGPVCATFSVEDLTLSHLSSDDYTCIKRAYIPDSEKAWFRRMGCIAPNLPANAISGKGQGIFLHRTSNTEISDSYIDSRFGIDFQGDRSTNKYVLVRNNTIRWRFAPYMVTYMNNGIVFEGNQIIMAGTESGNGFTPQSYPDIGEAFGTFSSNIRDVYYAHNVSSREDPNPIPSDSTVDMTFDGTMGAYFGQIISASGTVITLSGVTAGNDMYGHPPVYTGAIVQIVSGKGMGQSRVLRSSPTLTNTITIDQPWEVNPDETSWITIFDYMGRFLMVENTLTNHPRVQFYFPSSDIIFANNTVGVNGRLTQLLLWVAPRWNGFSTAMYFQVLNNFITRDGMIHQNVVNALDPHPTNYPGYTGLSQVYRGNTSDGAPLSFEPRYDLDQVLLENNHGASMIKFQIPTNSKNILIRKNTTSTGAVTPILNIDSPYINLP